MLTIDSQHGGSDRRPANIGCFNFRYADDDRYYSKLDCQYNDTSKIQKKKWG